VAQDYKIWQVIGASSVGTMIEWYDFYIFGSLATVIAPLFYPQGNDTLALIAYLSTFAVGFVVRPFGALFFGRIGDLVGRKYAFLVTLLIMGGATAMVGFLPTYATIGIAAPIILLLIRVLQGLALGGEYGGAAVYVAEHVPDKRRGFYTSFIQITATLGLFVSLAVILIVQNTMSKETFNLWGWRLPFIISIFLVGISLYIRLRMKESPIFQHLKSTGMRSTQPLKEAFTKWVNLKRVLISLFGATAGQGVSFQWRSSAGGGCGNQQVGGITAPVWLRLVRSGQTYTGSYSTNGTNWVQVGSQQISLSSTVFPTPRRPVSSMLFSGLFAFTRPRRTRACSRIPSRPTSSGGGAPAPGENGFLIGSIGAV